jgi:hypothetical protein
MLKRQEAKMSVQQNQSLDWISALYLKCLAQVSKWTVEAATKLLKLQPYKITVLYSLQWSSSQGFIFVNGIFNQFTMTNLIPRWLFFFQTRFLRDMLHTVVIFHATESEGTLYGRPVQRGARDILSWRPRHTFLAPYFTLPALKLIRISRKQISE